MSKEMEILDLSKVDNGSMLLDGCCGEIAGMERGTHGRKLYETNS